MISLTLNRVSCHVIKLVDSYWLNGHVVIWRNPNCGQVLIWFEYVSCVLFFNKTYFFGLKPPTQCNKNHPLFNNKLLIKFLFLWTWLWGFDRPLLTCLLTKHFIQTEKKNSFTKIYVNINSDSEIGSAQKATLIMRMQLIYTIHHGSHFLNTAENQTTLQLLELKKQTNGCFGNSYEILHQ